MVTREPGTQFYNSVTLNSKICCRVELIFKKSEVYSRLPSSSSLHPQAPQTLGLAIILIPGV